MPRRLLRSRSLKHALSGTGYCNGFANCTQAVVANEGVDGTGNLAIANVWSLYSDLDNGGFNFPRSMMNTPAVPVTIGCQRAVDLRRRHELQHRIWQLQRAVRHREDLGLEGRDACSRTSPGPKRWERAPKYRPPAPLRRLIRSTCKPGMACRRSIVPIVYNLFIVYQPHVVQVAVWLRRAPAGRMDHRSCLHHR